MNTKQAWEKYRTVGEVGSDKNLIKMMRGLVTTITFLQDAYGPDVAALVTRPLRQDYFDFLGFAQARGIKDYPELV